MLSDKQKTLYWRTWAAVCAEQGWAHDTASRKDERRYALHAAARCPISMTQFGNRDLDAFLRAARALMSPSAPARPTVDDGQRKRLLWRIRADAKSAGLDEAYIRRLSTDLTGLACYDELATDQLTHLRNLIHNRAGGRKKRSYKLDPAKSYANAHPY